MNPLALIFWLMEHWYVVAIAGAVVLAAAMWGGFISIAAIIKAALDILARIIRFFATPADQIAEKLLFGFVVACLAASLFYPLGKYDERGIWQRRELAHEAAMKKLSDDAAQEAQQRVDAATGEEKAARNAAEQRFRDAEERLKNATGDLLDAADLDAAGLRARPDRLNLRRRPR